LSIFFDQPIFSLFAPIGKMSNEFFKMVDLICCLRYTCIQARRNETYPLLFQPNVTIWQELGYEQNGNTSIKSDINTALQTNYDFENGENNDIEEEYCETMIIRLRVY
jgi:hypothetical protein